MSAIAFPRNSCSGRALTGGSRFSAWSRSFGTIPQTLNPAIKLSCSSLNFLQSLLHNKGKMFFKIELLKWLSFLHSFYDRIIIIALNEEVGLEVSPDDGNDQSFPRTGVVKLRPTGNMQATRAFFAARQHL